MKPDRLLQRHTEPRLWTTLTGVIQVLRKHIILLKNKIRKYLIVSILFLCRCFGLITRRAVMSAPRGLTGQVPHCTGHSDLENLALGCKPV